MPRIYSKFRKGKKSMPVSSSSNYYIANRANHTLYYLDIGIWWLLSSDKEYLLDPEKLPKFLLGECYNLNSIEDHPKIVDFVHNRLAPDLLNFCKDTDLEDIIIFNNLNQELLICRSLKYKFTGHRLYEKGSEHYNKLLNNLNSHLNSNHSQYNPNLYKNNPNYKIFIPKKLRIYL